MLNYKLGHLFLGWPFVNQLNLNILVILFFCKFLENLIVEMSSENPSVRMNSPLSKLKKKTRGSSSKTLCGKIAQLNATEPPTFREVAHHLNFLKNSKANNFNRLSTKDI